MGTSTPTPHGAPRGRPTPYAAARFLVATTLAAQVASCNAPAPTTPAAAVGPTTHPVAATSQPAVVYDTTLARPVPPRDFLERITVERGPDFKLVDRFMDPRTQPPPFEREPRPDRPPGTEMATGVPLLADTNPFAPEPELFSKEVTIHVAILQSTYRTREPAEVLSAAQPFIDLVQREVDVRGAADLLGTPDAAFYALTDAKDQMIISHVFDYLTVQSWFAGQTDNGTVLLAWAQPAYAPPVEADRAAAGIPGTALELIVAAGAPYQAFADLRGQRLALAARDTRGPGTFLTHALAEVGQAKVEPFFGKVTLRRYPKDALIDVLKGKADVACVDQGTVGALRKFYGIGDRIRTLAVSPDYNVDVIYTSVNNLETHRTQIELTQRQLTTLAKNPEGQEVLFFFDEQGWHNYRDGDINIARENFADFVDFLSHTPVDLQPLLDPNAPVDTHTYDRYGDD